MARNPKVTERIKRLKKHLEAILEGTIVPQWKNFPTTLSAARLYSAPKFGIIPIGSPNEFTRTHPLHCETVEEIHGLLKDIEKINPELPKSDRESPPEGGGVEVSQSAEFPDRKTILSQWHTARQEAEDAAHLRIEVDRLLAVLASRDQEIKAKDLEIKRLQKVKLALRIVE